MLQLISNNNDQKSPKSNRKPIRVNLLKIICNTITTWEFFLYKSHQLQLFNKKLSRAVRAQDSSFFLYSLSLSQSSHSNQIDNQFKKKKTMTPSFLSQLSWSPPSLPFLEKERKKRESRETRLCCCTSNKNFFIFFFFFQSRRYFFTPPSCSPSPLSVSYIILLFSLLHGLTLYLFFFYKITKFSKEAYVLVNIFDCRGSLFQLF